MRMNNHITFMYNNNRHGLIIKNKKKVFRPLLSRAQPSSTLFENNDIFIPLANPRPIVKPAPKQAVKRTSQSIQHESAVPEKVEILVKTDTVDPRIYSEPNKPAARCTKYAKPKKGVIGTFHSTSYNYLSAPGKNILKTNSYGFVTTSGGGTRKLNRAVISRGNPAKMELPVVTEKQISAFPSINPFEVYETKPRTKARRAAAVSQERKVRGTSAAPVKPQTAVAVPRAEVQKLTEEETKIYGNRFPTGYQKLYLLGKGGCAVVWLGKDVATNEKAAIKQFSKMSGNTNNKAELESCKVEILVGEMLFGGSEITTEAIQKQPGKENIAKYITYVNDVKDIWIIHEVGGTSLTKLLFDVKGWCGVNFLKF